MTPMIQEITDLFFPEGLKKRLQSLVKQPPQGFQNPFQSPGVLPDSNFLSSIVERWMSNRTPAIPNDWENLQRRVAELERRLEQNRAIPAKEVRIFSTQRTGRPS